MKRLKNFFAHPLYFSVPVLLFATPLVVAAKLPTTCGEVRLLLDRISGSLAAIVGSLAVLMILIAAFYFITGGGNEEARTKGKTFLIYAIVGVIVALFAFVLPQLVTSILGGPEAGC